MARRPPEKKETFTTRLPPHTAKFVRGLAKSEKNLVSTIISELIEEAINARVKSLLPSASASTPSASTPSAGAAPAARDSLSGPSHRLSGASQPSTPTIRPAAANNPHGTLRNQAEATELILKEIRRRGGNPDLEARLEKSIRDLREKKT